MAKRFSILIIGVIIAMGWYMVHPAMAKAEGNKAVHYDICGRTLPNKTVQVTASNGHVAAQTVSNDYGVFTLVVAVSNQNPFPWTVSAEDCENTVTLNESDFKPGTCVGGQGKHINDVKLCLSPSTEPVVPR